MLRACGMKLSPVAGSELADSRAAGRASSPTSSSSTCATRSHLPAALPVLKRQHPTTGVIIVANRLDPAMLLEAMRSGVNEVVADPVTVADLEAAIARLDRPTAGHAREGAIYAFLGAKGGVGTTTVAVNVATALARLVPKSTLFIDLARREW